MQKCSELGSNLEVWQYLSRYGLPALKVNKGPEGHRLVQECHDQIKKALPADSYDKVMVWVNRWLKSLDEKDAKTKLYINLPAGFNTKVTLPVKPKPCKVNKKKQSTKNITENNNSIVDLCSDDEITENNSDTLFDCNTIVAKSQLVIHDDEFGDIHLKDYAAHVEGKQPKGSENEENDQGTHNMRSAQDNNDNNDDKNISQVTSQKNLELSVGTATMKTYLITSSKPKPKEALIRVRTDLKPTAAPPEHNTGKLPELQKKNKTQNLPSASKRKLSIEQPRKPCDSTTEGSESCPKKRKQDLKKDLGILLQESIDKASPDTTSTTTPSMNIVEPNSVLSLTHILGLLDCVESYATWQHNSEATDLLVQLRASLQQEKNSKSQ